MADSQTPAYKRQWWINIVTWGLLFVALVLAVWAATQSRDAPQLILLALLYVIAIQFSLPPTHSSVGLVPVVAVSSLLVVGLPTAVFLMIIGYFLAELARPLWQPLWETIEAPRTSRWQRLMAGIINLLSLLAGAAVYGQVNNQSPQFIITDDNFTAYLALSIGFGAAYLGLNLLWWLGQKRPLRQFLTQNSYLILTAGFLAQPFAIWGGSIFGRTGLPTFIIFCLGVMMFSIIAWLSWQRRFVADQQLSQFTMINRASASLRQTLELPQVIEHTYRLVAELIPMDQFAIWLHDNGWHHHPYPPSPISNLQSPIFPPHPDDFTHWVADNGRSLHVDNRHMHFAARHGLTPPEPQPAVWIGLPLMTAEKLIGVMVLQQFQQERPFTQWHQELLLAIADQAGAAIQNAQQHGETVRLYHQADEALAQRVKQLQALLDTINEGVLMIDTTGTVVLINPVATAFLDSYTPSLHQPLDTSAVAPSLGYTAGELDHLLAQLQAGSHPGHGRTEYEHNQQGQRHIIERHEGPVLSADEQLLGWLILFRDVTDERELAARRADLTHMIVHDLRNPLTTIRSNIELAQKQLAAETTIHASLDDVRDSALDLLDMVDSLMDVNRLEAGQPVIDAEAIRLSPLVEKVTGRLRSLAARKQIRLEVTTPPDLPAVWADAEIMRRVFLNLLDNALKFTPANGRIYIQLQSEPSHTEVSEPGIRCMIQDTGPGIPAEHRGHVFDKFMRTNEGGAQIRGTGLGLTFCKLAIEAHNGRIWIEDAPDGGTQFLFTLPGIPRIYLNEKKL